MEKKNRFTHLHLHTPYSLLDGFAKIDQVMQRTKSYGMDSVAITDHGVMFGAVEFYKSAKKHGIHPVIGCEVYTAARSMHDKESLDKRSGHLVLLAENNKGYQNLIKIVSSAFVEGFYYKPRVDLALLRKYSEGLIALSACLAGDVQQRLLSGNYDQAKEIACEFRDIFGPNNFFLEMQDHGIREQKRVNIFLKKLSQDTKIPLVVTNDVHYVDREDAKTHDVLLCIQTGKTLADEHKMEFETEEFYFKSADEMYELFPEESEALENTWKIAQRCRVEFDFETVHLPEYQAPAGYEKASYFRELCREGAKRRYGEISDEVRERLDFEIQVIEKMGYVEYFLIVWDFIDFSKKNNIKVGPGRGSAAGSIVAYVLGITDIDPLKYALLFERFLNPERITLPDIDIDFCYEKRDLVIDYVKEKYGEDHVSQIITFGTLGARSAIRDVGRVMGVSYTEVDKIAKEIPFALNMTIDRAMELNPNLRTMYEENGAARDLINIAKNIEGLPRHASTHAAGVVISKEPVDHYVPLYTQQDESITTQFSMGTLEELGLLKMDFLGLRTLTVIQKTFELIEKHRGVKIDFSSMEYDDPLVYELLSSGETLGVFQLESSGMRHFMKELRPDTFEDIIAGISLYRPGPMESIPQYVKNKNFSDRISYVHEKMEPILNVTRGILVYQEQVMQVVRDLAGYSYGRSDLVRRAMSKKKMDVMEEERRNFVYGKDAEDGSIEILGCIRNGIDEKTANKIYDDMIDFAKYAFNKSHAAAYAVLAYETAYLKTHYKVEFMAALMTSVMGNTDKVVEYIRECDRMNIKVLKPDVNRSLADFSVEEENIRYSLSAVKNIGISVVNSLVEEREKNGEYLDFHDIAYRLPSRDLNKRVIESMIKCGALDEIIHNRASMMASYEGVMNAVASLRKNNIEGQISLFDSSFMEGVEKPKTSSTTLHLSEFDEKELLSMEKEVLGLYLSGHPLNQYMEVLKKTADTDTLQLRQYKENYAENQDKDNKAVIIGGVVGRKSIKTTRKKEMMAFVSLEDMYGSIEVIVFPKVFSDNAQFLAEDTPLLVSGRLSLKEDEEPKIIAEKMQPLRETIQISLYLKVPDIMDKEFQRAIRRLLQRYPGSSDVYYYDEKTKRVYSSSDEKKVDICEELLEDLYDILGRDNVKTK